jgi:hypothetical protein
LRSVRGRLDWRRWTGRRHLIVFDARVALCAHLYRHFQRISLAALPILRTPRSLWVIQVDFFLGFTNLGQHDKLRLSPCMGDGGYNGEQERRGTRRNSFPAHLYRHFQRISLAALPILRTPRSLWVIQVDFFVGTNLGQHDKLRLSPCMGDGGYNGEQERRGTRPSLPHSFAALRCFPTPYTNQGYRRMLRAAARLKSSELWGRISVSTTNSA